MPGGGAQRGAKKKRREMDWCGLGVAAALTGLFAAQVGYFSGRRMSQVTKMAWRMSSFSNSGLPVGL